VATSGVSPPSRFAASGPFAARKRSSSGCDGAVRRERDAHIHRPHPDAERAEDKLQIRTRVVGGRYALASPPHSTARPGPTPRSDLLTCGAAAPSVHPSVAQPSPARPTSPSQRAARGSSDVGSPLVHPFGGEVTTRLCWILFPSRDEFYKDWPLTKMIATVAWYLPLQSASASRSSSTRRRTIQGLGHSLPATRSSKRSGQ
jgi:hypothetical protein